MSEATEAGYYPTCGPDRHGQMRTGVACFCRHGRVVLLTEHGRTHNCLHHYDKCLELRMMVLGATGLGGEA